MFQPGEEGFHGARVMIEDGLLDGPPDAAFALHVMPNARHGQFAGRAGPLMASMDNFELRILGRGGHASMPHQAIDPIAIGCEIISAVQTWVTRRIPALDPAVVTFARFTAGNSHTVIPERAEIWGTVRAISGQTRQIAVDGLKQIAEAVAQSPRRRGNSGA